MTTKSDAANREGESSIKAIIHSITDAWHQSLTKPGIVIISTFVALLIWGPLGKPLFYSWLEPWVGQDLATQGFRRQLVSYLTGFVLLVLIPILLIRFRFKEPLSNFGLGLGNVRMGLSFTVLFSALTIVPFYFTARDPQMMREYPMLYAGLSDEQLRSAFDLTTFVEYELLYGVFFLVIEFTFRGYLLFGLKDQFGGAYAILIQMLPYIAWHLAKPVAEMWPTPIWGFVVAAVTLRIGSVWYIFLAHWLLNIFMDSTILMNRGIF
jgi:membrane protease YdiL (CAAX protease family)